MPGEITPERLAELQDRGEPFVLLDSRDPDSYRAWHVPGAQNFPFGRDETLSGEQLSEVEALIGDADTVVTVCALARSSSQLADELVSHGHDAVVVAGGMAAWSRVYHTVSVDVGPEHVSVLQLQRRAKGCLGYVVADEPAGEAAVIDPSRHTAEFVEAADGVGCDVVAVLDTHVHADHLSGGPALAAELGVPYYLGERAVERGVSHEFEPLGQNEAVEIGDVACKALFTPGHTTESVSYLLDDTAVLTGDTLFVGGVGRTELEFGEADAATGAQLLYDSLHATLLGLPDTVAVLPGHAAVADDGRWIDATPGEPVMASVGDLRRGLSVLGLDEDAFVERVATSSTDKPSNYETVIGVNRGSREPVTDDEATVLELGPNRCAAP